MFIVDDPMLALIARFIVGGEKSGPSNEDFLRAQVAAIEAHVSRFPQRERQERALEWIEAHAERYRLSWQRANVRERLQQTRCADCPLAALGGSSCRCEIHARWMALLDDFIAGKISSHEYVEHTLSLLRAHKSRLAVVAADRHGTARTPQ